MTGQSFHFVCLDSQCHLALWVEGTLSLLGQDGTYHGLDEMIPDGLHSYPRRPRGLSWKGTHGGEPPTRTTELLFDFSSMSSLLPRIKVCRNKMKSTRNSTQNEC